MKRALFASACVLALSMSYMPKAFADGSDAEDTGDEFAPAWRVGLRHDRLFSGTPVIGLNRGGATETIIHNQTGILLDSDEPGIVKNAILNFDASKYDREFIKAHAQKFAKARFKEEFLHTINKL